MNFIHTIGLSPTRPGNPQKTTAFKTRLDSTRSNISPVPQTARFSSAALDAKLKEAVLFNNPSTVMGLLARADKPDVNMVHERKPIIVTAVKQGHENIALALIKAGAKVNYVDTITGRTLLHYAASLNQVSLLQVLLGQKDPTLTVNQQNEPYRETPLMIASEVGSLDAVKLLLKAGADVNLKDHWDQTAFLEACESGHTLIASLLLENKANPNTPDHYNDTPLAHAAYKGRANTVKWLLAQKKIQINTKGQFDQTPLFWAVQAGHTDVVRLLLEKGADANIPNEEGTTPLVEAVRHGDEGKSILLALLAKKPAADKIALALEEAYKSKAEKIVALLFGYVFGDEQYRNYTNRNMMQFLDGYYDN